MTRKFFCDITYLQAVPLLFYQISKYMPTTCKVGKDISNYRFGCICDAKIKHAWYCNTIIVVVLLLNSVI